MLPEFKHILYATDLSETARLALRHATSLANHYQAKLTIIHVLPDWVQLMSGEIGFDIPTHLDYHEVWRDMNVAATASASEKAKTRVVDMIAECKRDDPNCPVTRAEIKVVQGDATVRILEELKEGDCDLVVMGAHGQGPLMGIILGSVANKIVRMSPVPVLTVRLPKD